VVRGRVALYGPARIIDLIDACTQKGRNIYVDATRIAEGLFASHLAVNIFLLGAAYQSGLIPISAGSIEQAIRLNRVEAERNVQAFQWGRKYYVDARAVEDILEPPKPASKPLGLVERRVVELAQYQDRRYAEEYRAFVERVAAREPALAETVARYLYKLMAYKDEYEVARLLTQREFEAQVSSMWEAAESVRYNLHPPILRALGLKRKVQLGPWFRVPLRWLGRLKMLRGTPFDPFGYAELRREERALIAWYRSLVEALLAHVTPENLPLAMEIAALPDQIRGYENIKMDKIREVKRQAEEKLGLVRQAPVPV
jgi:indolepyruvate ferredoxin oxidoreductase